MRITALKTIYLTADELKQAIVEYLEKDHEELAQHLYDNDCEMVWGQDGKEFLVSIDGEIEESREVDISAAADKIIENHKEALQKLADMPSAVCDACGCEMLPKNAPLPKSDNTETRLRSHYHPRTNCVVYQEGGIGCPDCYCDGPCTDDCPICGGNTPERVEEQIEWLKKLAKVKND